SGVGVTITSQLDVTNINASGVTTTTEVRSNALSLKNAAGSATYATFTNGGSALLKWNNTDRLETTTSGVTVTGTVAATSYTGDGSQLTGINASGISTISGVVSIVNDLDVDGHTNLDNVSIAGVTTFASDLVIPQDIIHAGDTDTKIRFGTDSCNLIVGGNTKLGASSAGVLIYGNVLRPSQDNQAFLGTNVGPQARWKEVHAVNFYGDGSGLTNVIGSGSGIIVKD
ncbi:MAG: hypothetical protein VXY93_16705, partial [Pseudomonadota bacterium]|nr:hypothetical protein [Pseudomonadota bacterium]